VRGAVGFVGGLRVEGTRCGAWDRRLRECGFLAVSVGTQVFRELPKNPVVMQVLGAEKPEVVR
jgi:hypothetical protein